MEMILAAVCSALFITSAALGGRWFKRTEEARRSMIRALWIVGVLSCFMGGLILFSDMRPEANQLHVALATATGSTMLLAGAFNVLLAGYSSADR